MTPERNNCNSGLIYSSSALVIIQTASYVVCGDCMDPACGLVEHVGVNLKAQNIWSIQMNAIVFTAILCFIIWVIYRCFGWIWAKVSGLQKGVSLEQAIEQAIEQAALPQEGFKSDICYVNRNNLMGLAIDNTNNQILLYDHPQKSVMPFNNLIATEVLEDGVSVSRTNRGSQLIGAAVGGVLLGGAGAIIGGLSGSTTSSDRVKKVILRVVTDDIQRPNFDMVFLDVSATNKKGIEKSDPKYKEAIENAAAWHSRLTTILKRLSEKDAAHNPTAVEQLGSSVADEIGKLAQLRDNGLLTQEEFTTQKISLLAS